MPFQPAITDLEQLKNHPAVAKLTAWNSAAVESAKFDRDEMSIYVERSFIRDACMLLRDDAGLSVQLSCRRHLCGLVSFGAALRSGLPLPFDSQERARAIESAA